MFDWSLWIVLSVISLSIDVFEGVEFPKLFGASWTWTFWSRTSAGLGNLECAALVRLRISGAPPISDTFFFFFFF